MASTKKSCLSGQQSSPLRFGPWLRELRSRKGLALREVASAVKMDQAHLSKAELGQRIPTASQVMQLALFFEIPLTHMEARRVAEKALQEIESSPLAQEALSILREGKIELNQLK